MSSALIVNPPMPWRFSPAFLIILTLIASLTLPLKCASAGGEGLSAGQLKEKAQKAYLERHYEEAAAINSEIAERLPDSDERRYAVIMLGNIYEENIVDLEKAIRWDREFLQKYADDRQAQAYREKIAFLEKMTAQKEAFKAYQAIRSAGYDDKTLVEKYEAFLKAYPDFSLRASIESELGYAYGHLDEREKSYEAFKSIGSNGGKGKLSPTDRASYEDARRYYQMSTTWAYAAWAVIAALWAWVLAMRPWERVTRAGAKRFMVYPALWVLGVIASIPIFNSLHVEGYELQIPISALYIAAGLNLVVLLWLFLFTRGRLWADHSRLLRVFSPVLTLVMTSAVFYLFIVYNPQGPYITDLFTVKYDYWKGEIHEHGFSFRIPGR